MRVTASPQTGYGFGDWTLDGANAGTTYPLAVTMSANHTWVANFAKNAATTNTVTLTPAPDRTLVMSPTGGSYTSCSTVTLTATPQTGYRFVSWAIDGVDRGGTNPYTLTVSGNHTVVANFAAAALRYLYIPLATR